MAQQQRGRRSTQQTASRVTWRSAGVVLVALAALGGMPQQARAIGCLSGAAAGGVAGHFAGRHTYLGAAAGCVVGHHAAVMEKRRAAAAAAQQQGSYSQGTGGSGSYQNGGAPSQQ